MSEDVGIDWQDVATHLIAAAQVADDLDTDQVPSAALQARMVGAIALATGRAATMGLRIGAANRDGLATADLTALRDAVAHLRAAADLLEPLPDRLHPTE